MSSDKFTCLVCGLWKPFSQEMDNRPRKTVLGEYEGICDDHQCLAKAVFYRRGGGARSKTRDVWEFYHA